MYSIYLGISALPAVVLPQRRDGNRDSFEPATMFTPKASLLWRYEVRFVNEVWSGTWFERRRTREVHYPTGLETALEVGVHRCKLSPPPDNVTSSVLTSSVVDLPDYFSRAKVQPRVTKPEEREPALALWFETQGPKKKTRRKKRDQYYPTS
ncbi:hypothetical protein K435DRAFT_799437 [Dendrothele bispora CBS 962.96]|uniref:Uncharacterized protein n=1 Tax=Dendrothele bispora (strain CBS 962.96) TaxID=1314807 RepID=A0A4S8LX42_DENBC|nr:hypothetical protein K435DRAFT_799437 [Dendrothele bispora CBS 962.96]